MDNPGYERDLDMNLYNMMYGGMMTDFGSGGSGPSYGPSQQ